MIIKAMRLQAWAPAGGGGKSKPSPPPQKKFFGYIGGLFATFSSYGALFATFFSFLGVFSPCWEPFCYFLLHGGGLFGGVPPLPTKISAGSHDCKEASRACCPEIFCVTTI